MSAKTWGLTAAGLLISAAVVVAIVSGGGGGSPASAQTAPPPTAEVQRGPLSALVSGTGTLTYRAQPDGSPYTAVNQTSGVLTQLPTAGSRIGCGEVMYRVDSRPVLLLCGRVPAYRDLRVGVSGPDVRQLNRDLGIGGNRFSDRTRRSVQVLQRRRGMPATGALALGDAVFLPDAVRIAKVAGDLGGPARPGAPVLIATTDKLRVRVDLDASQQNGVKNGDTASITLPGNRSVKGRVTGFGRVAQTAAGSQPADATIPTFIDLDDPVQVRGLDQAPVQVDITTKGVDDALSVPVTALVGKAGGGYAVEVVGAGRRRRLIAVQLGLFDTGGGRVQVRGDLKAGDAVVVPSV